MNTHFPRYRTMWRLSLMAACASLAAPMASAQVPVDESGNPVQPLDETVVAAEAAEAPVELMSADTLQALVGPIALYPDDLLAIVLPASTYPLEIVQAARFLDDHENDESLTPDDSWDESVTALLNYPEVINMLNDDLDWTWRLGEAVVNQQADVIAAVEAFRDRAYAAGNLKSDEYQTVSNNDDGVIEIQPVSEEVIYVPYYEPERVVVYQPRPAYYYYPQPYPVYYYPYPHGYNFHSNYFWGVTTAFSIGWTTNHLHVFHHSYYGHPYYGHTYYPQWWYRRPSITVYNNWYGTRSERTRDHYANGDYWRPHNSGGARPGFNRSRGEYFAERRRERNSEGYRDPSPGADNPAARPAAQNNANRSGFRSNDTRSQPGTRDAGEDRTIRFREREGRILTPTSDSQQRDPTVNRERTGIPAERQRGPSAVPERSNIPVERAAPRATGTNDVSRRVTDSTDRSRSATVTRESTTLQPARQSSIDTRRPAAVSAPQRAPTARSSGPVSVISRPAPGASTSRSIVTRPTVSAPRSAPSPAAVAPRSAPSPAVSAPRSAPSPAVSAPRSAPRVSAPNPAPRSGATTRRPSSDNGRGARQR